MLIIPAIDILDRKCVRLRQGSYQDSTVFGDDPVAMAQAWVQQGARFLHVVDLEGARSGRPQVLDLLGEIAQLGPPVQIGGGMRELEHLEAALAAGATRVVVGSRAADDPEFAREVIQLFGPQAVIGIDARDGRVAVQGWQQASARSIEAVELAREVERLGAARIVFTDIARDGMLAGPNFAALAEMIAAVRIPIVASGGITRLEDVRRVKESGAEACIIGRALYSGELALPAALEAASE